MKRVGFLLKVKSDKLEEYKKQHEHVWQEMLDALRRTGWHNYSLFLRDDGLLFGYFEAAESFQKSLALDSSQDETWVWLAKAFQKQGHNAKARDAAEHALQLNPRSRFAKETAANIEK